MTRQQFDCLDDEVKEQIVSETYQHLKTTYRELHSLHLTEDTDDPEAADMWAYDNLPRYMGGWL